MRVVFRQRARQDLENLYLHLASSSGNAETALGYVLRLRAACQSLSDFPRRGTLREDVRQDLRILTFEQRCLIAYRVASEVEIIAVFHGGQDWTTNLQEP